MTVLRFWVDHEPAPQGSKRIGRSQQGKPIILDDNDVAKRQWRQAVHAAALFAMTTAGFRCAPAGTPLAVEIRFFMERPLKHHVAQDRARPLRAGVPNVCTTKPDVDKLVRSTLDSLTTAGAIDDDAAVVHLDAQTLYSGRGMVGAGIVLQQVCRLCSCTDTHACTGGCSWTKPGLCSSHA